MPSCFNLHGTRRQRVRETSAALPVRPNLSGLTCLDETLITPLVPIDLTEGECSQYN